MKIYVDADACPVKKEIERVASRNKIEVLLVSNGGLRPISHPLIQNVFVSNDADAADKWIVDNGQLNDLVITADIILADNCIKKGMLVLKPNGEELNQSNIGNTLSLRDLSSDLRAANPFFQGSGKTFSKQDKIRFLDNLEKIIRIINQKKSR
jgi:uncharacterized protein YaiI (UPF0178 family)|tara:strand:- start:3162 stop:3620 length:459 start_codon:yes stop_codon:yes gene_type:complete